LSDSGSSSRAPARPAPPASALGGAGVAKKKNGTDPVSRDDWQAVVDDPTAPEALRTEAAKAIASIDRQREVDTLVATTTPKERH
jgi:hypothetical protein